MTTETNNEYASKGVAGTGLGLGIAGTALGLLAGGGTLFNGLGGASSKPTYVTKEEHKADMKIAAKDSEIALLKAEKDDEKKMVEVYTALATQINAVKEKIADNKEQLTNRIDLTSETLRTKIDENRDRGDDRLAAVTEKLNGKIDFNKNFQDGINAQQLAYNGTNGATIACMQNQINLLLSLTKLVVPNSSVCPGWGQVTIYPTPLSAI